MKLVFALTDLSKWKNIFASYHNQFFTTGRRSEKKSHIVKCKAGLKGSLTKMQLK